MSFDFSKIGAFLLAALIVFLIYRRFRRNFGQQPLRPVRMQIRIGILVLVGAILAPAALRSMAFLTATLAGVAVGIGLAVWGGSQTRFLKIDNQRYYVPHTHTGIAVSMLFLGRLVYRLIQVYAGAHGAPADAANQAFLPASMLTSPLTLSLFFVLMGYYVCYYSIVLWKSKQL